MRAVALMYIQKNKNAERHKTNKICVNENICFLKETFLLLLLPLLLQPFYHISFYQMSDCAEPLSHTTYNRKPLFQYHLIFSLKRLCANNFQCNQNAVTIQLHSLTWEWQRMCDSCRCGTDVRCDTYMYIFYMWNYLRRA